MTELVPSLVLVQDIAVPSNRMLASPAVPEMQLEFGK